MFNLNNLNTWKLLKFIQFFLSFLFDGILNIDLHSLFLTLYYARAYARAHAMGFMSVRDCGQFRHLGKSFVGPE